MKKEILVLENIAKRYGNKVLFDGLNFKINQGTFYLIKGQNGAGKTSLLKIIAGLVRPDKGVRKVYLSSKHGKLFGFVFDNLPDINFTVFEYIYLVGRISGIKKNILLEKIDTLAHKLNFKEFLNTNISSLSKGTRQKILIVQALINNPLILIMDEPFSGLDDKSRKALLELLKDYKSQGGTIVLVSHEFEFLQDLIDSVYYLHNKKLHSYDYKAFENCLVKIVASFENAKLPYDIFENYQYTQNHNTVEVVVSKNQVNDVLIQLIKSGLRIEKVIDLEC